MSFNVYEKAKEVLLKGKIEQLSNGENEFVTCYTYDGFQLINEDDMVAYLVDQLGIRHPLYHWNAPNSPESEDFWDWFMQYSKRENE